MNKIAKLTDEELNEVLTYLQNLIKQFCPKDHTNMEGLKSYIEHKETIENFMNDDDYTSYKEFIINCLDHEARYIKLNN